MSTVKSDSSSQSFLSHLMGYSLLIGLLLYFLNKRFGKTIRTWLFASYWKRAMGEYHSAMRDVKKSHFDSMHKHSSSDQNLKKKKILRILEIGAGPGANFEFFPPNSKLMVVEPNAYFEPLFYENQIKYPDVKMEKFIIACAEDMKDIKDNSIDVVVSTLVLCSVRSVEETLAEIHRVLAPGGKYFFWEHIHDRPGTWLHFVQNIVNPFWNFFSDGCNINRNIDHTLRGCKVFSQVNQKFFYVNCAPLRNGLWRFVRAHVKGVAIK